MKPRAFGALGLAIGVLLAGCTSGGGEPGGETEPEATGDAAASSPSAEPLLDAPGLGQVELLSLSEGAGDRPKLEWEPVEGAEWYSLVVYSSNAEPYWAWEGARTSTFLGGAKRIPEDHEGPRLVEGMSWSVVAHDSDDQPLAVSAIRPIGP